MWFVHIFEEPLAFRDIVAGVVASLGWRHQPGKGGKVSRRHSLVELSVRVEAILVAGHPSHRNVWCVDGWCRPEDALAGFVCCPQPAGAVHEETKAHVVKPQIVVDGKLWERGSFPATVAVQEVGYDTAARRRLRGVTAT